ncbi:MAG: Ethyl tert-butyl ether degradation EthD [Candidatus Solibacter sp.]|nr:Ethyl tert-butyl ether degradation EthD [Candidatus Solibacter sp.]
MIRLSVLYPATPGSRFDWDYYLGAHVELVHRLWDPLGLVKVEIDRGIGSLPPGAPAPFHAVGNLTFPTLVDLQTALFSAGTELAADQAKYTDVQSVVMISEVI